MVVRLMSDVLLIQYCFIADLISNFGSVETIRQVLFHGYPQITYVILENLYYITYFFPSLRTKDVMS